MTDHVPLRVLVTGGAGFIGSNFVRAFVARNPATEVVVLDLLTYAGTRGDVFEAPKGRHRFVHGNICDRDLVRSLFRSHAIDTVVHFAAETHVDRSIADPDVFIETNIVGTFTLLEAARATWRSGASCRFHHVSTDEVFGSLQLGDRPFDERSPYRPNSPYSASKASSDHLVRAYSHTYGLPVTISHCSNNYGPYQNDEKFVPTVIRACLTRQAIPIYGDGTHRRDWLYVDDHCEALETIVRTGHIGETYCLGGGCECANIDIARNICALADASFPDRDKHEALIKFVSDRPGHDWRYAIASDKARIELGWTPRHNLALGLDKTFRWYAQRLSDATT